MKYIKNGVIMTYHKQIITNEKFKKVSISTPIQPEIELDGGFAYCARCYKELDCYTTPCPKCNQIQDWSWMKCKGGKVYED